MKTWALSGSFSTFLPATNGCRSGVAPQSTMKSISGVMPMLFKAEPQNTNAAVPLEQASFMPCSISLSVNSSPSRYFASKSSSASAAASTRASLYLSTSSIKSAGISCSLALPVPPSKIKAFILIRSTTPLKESSAPMGSCTGTILSEKLSFIWSSTL